MSVVVNAVLLPLHNQLVLRRQLQLESCRRSRAIKSPSCSPCPSPEISHLRCCDRINPSSPHTNCVLTKRLRHRWYRILGLPNHLRRRPPFHLVLFQRPAIISSLVFDCRKQVARSINLRSRTVTAFSTVIIISASDRISCPQVFAGSSIYLIIISYIEQVISQLSSRQTTCHCRKPFSKNFISPNLGLFRRVDRGTSNTMTAVISPSHSPAPSPRHQQFSPTNTSAPSLPPLNTSQSSKRSPLQRPPSYAKNRMSAYSTVSKLSESRSRPISHAFPVFHSSLPYTLVRDFAYPVTYPMHYGPPPDVSEAASGNTTPASERQRRLSDPPSTVWDVPNPEWSTGPWDGEAYLGNQQLPQLAYGDGPPYSEDDDLHSPIVASRHKKARSGNGKGRSSSSGEQTYMGQENDGDRRTGGGSRGFLAGINGDGSEGYYTGREDDSANDPSGNLVTYPPDQHSAYMDASVQQNSHYDTLPSRSYLPGDSADSEDETGSGTLDPDDSRLSRDYQFTIASPDEEMHGKAVALFDFARENENELPLVEGQIIWVSYRHGQGWLVAEDPKTGDAGLVPEEYVRLLRDIEGGWSSLSGEESPTAGRATIEDTAGTTAPPIQATNEAESIPTPSISMSGAHTSNGDGSKSEKRPPVVSMFSTSSKDLDPYPHNLRGSQTTSPPNIVHQPGSQNNIPTISSTKVANINPEVGHEESQ